MKIMKKKHLSDFLFLIMFTFCWMNLSAQIPYQQGFPINTGNNTSEPSPQVADIDGDGDLEVLIGSGQNLFAYHHDGTPVAGFPVGVGGSAHYTPAIADIDNDGEIEIVIAGQRSDLYVFNGDGTLKEGWPQNLGDDDGACCSPALSDLDNDGDLEIVIGTYKDLNLNNDGILARVYVFHHDGTIYDGWPVYDVDYTGVIGSPAIGDLDNDGDLEIIVVGREYSQVWAWNTDGTVLLGFPVDLPNFTESSPTLADIDDDGDLEIFIATQTELVCALHHDGTSVTGWPQPMGGAAIQRSSPSIGDIDGDGDLEIVCGSWHGAVYAWHHNGTMVSGWPQPTGDIFQDFAQASPALADIDSDGDIEIVAAAYTGVFAWHHDGTLLPDYPLETGWSRSSPTITDLDGDGDIEILIGSMDDNLYAWDLEGNYNTNNIEWSMFRYDLLNTGCYQNETTGIEEFPPDQLLPASIVLHQNYPNPFNPSTTISFSLTTESTENTELIIYNLKGQKVKTFSNLPIYKSLKQQIVWDGTDKNNQPVSSGIYFYKLKTGGEMITKKMLLLE
ncbi:MAG: T9SS type A sorting domain-containing protein [Candidatus Cloacimonetes bacterium]|nr:T9SS type A sorting domain-containing protein [Candidatus Cloacimonadota bacterium]